MKKVKLIRYKCEKCNSKYKLASDAIRCEEVCSCLHNGDVHILYGGTLHCDTVYLECSLCKSEIERVDKHCDDELANKVAKTLCKSTDSKEIRALYAKLKQTITMRI